MAKFKITMGNTSTATQTTSIMTAKTQEIAREKVNKELRAWFNCGGALPRHIYIVSIEEV